MQELKIDPEFQALIPPMRDSEYKLLEESIKKGFDPAYPIIIQNGVIIDGHNRYELCKKHNVDFITIEKVFLNRNETKLWILDNQGNRRNVSDGWKYQLELTKKAILLEMGKEKESVAGKKGRQKQLGGLSEVDKPPKHNTQMELADSLGWSTGKVAMADKVWKVAP